MNSQSFPLLNLKVVKNHFIILRNTFAKTESKSMILTILFGRENKYFSATSNKKSYVTTCQPGVNFINVLLAPFMRADPKSAKTIKLSIFSALLRYGHKSCLWKVDKIDTWAQFHQLPTYSFYTCRSRKCKKYS